MNHKKLERDYERGKKVLRKVEGRVTEHERRCDSGRGGWRKGAEVRGRRISVTSLV